MTRWRRAADYPRCPATGNRAKGRPRTILDEYDGLVLLRPSPDVPPWPDDVAGLARLLAREERARGVFTLVVGAQGGDKELWTSLATVLDSLRERGVATVRLALSGAAVGGVNWPAAAQRIADAWGIEVIAPDSDVLIVPGGSLFVPGSYGPRGGWWSFTPRAEPAPLGPRSPAPSWQSAIARLPGRSAGGHVVEQIPAGILLRSPRARRSRAGDLCYAVPVDAHHPAVLLDPADADVPAEDLAALLAMLPATTRSAVRLAPYGPVDLLPVGQETARLLGAEVQVLTGLPLVVGAEADLVVRPVLVGADARPTWTPFVEAVACRPYGADGSVPAPRLVRWRSPVSGAGLADRGVVLLSDRWQVSVTRAGLVVGPRDRTPALAGRPVSPDHLAVEVDLCGMPADETLFADLSGLLSGFEAGVREFVSLRRVPPAGGSDDSFRLLRLAIEHGVSLESPAAEQPPVRAARAVPKPRARPPQEAPSARPRPFERPAPVPPSTARAAEPSASHAVRAAGGARTRPPGGTVRHSTEAERAEFRSLAQAVWGRYSASADRALRRIPALRDGRVDAARIDLVAVHVHLAGGLGALDLPAGAEVPGSYAACLASGLCRLPAYEGAVVRGGLPARLERFMPGAVLREPGPVSALPIGVAADLPAVTGGYVIWSSAGRRVRPLLGSAFEEVVFPPGAVFRVLDVRFAGRTPIVLLNEAGTGDADRAALARLDEAMRRQASMPARTSLATWPARCAEPLGGRHDTAPAELLNRF